MFCNSWQVINKYSLSNLFIFLKALTMRSCKSFAAFTIGASLCSNCFTSLLISGLLNNNLLLADLCDNSAKIEGATLSSGLFPMSQNLTPATDSLLGIPLPYETSSKSHRFGHACIPALWLFKWWWW